VKHYLRYYLQGLYLSTVVSCIALSMSACSSNPTRQSASSLAATNSAKVAVTVTDTGCQPTQLTVAQGKNTFEITNNSSQILEWEILKDGMVVEEQENIVPKFVQTLKADLKAGQYKMTCGLRSNPKGTIIVTAK
jgi:iron uptake system component EfeO